MHVIPNQYLCNWYNPTKILANSKEVDQLWCTNFIIMSTNCSYSIQYIYVGLFAAI